MSTQPDCTAVNAHSVSGSSESTDCGRCHAPDYTEYCPSQPSPPAVGDIWAIQETPGTFVRIATGHENRKSSSTKRKGRPAVFLQPGPRRGRARKGVQGPQQTKCLICLLATFGHEADITKLSQILQFFSLPVYPHQALSAPDCSQTPPHVHTSPEWCEKNAWLIAYSFKSSATIDGRWENPSAQSGSSYRLGEKSLSALLDVCEQKRREWDQFIQQHPDVAKRWFQEYQEDNARIWEERSMSRASKASTSSRRGDAGLRSTPPEVPPASALPEGPALSGRDFISYSSVSTTAENTFALTGPTPGLSTPGPKSVAFVEAIDSTTIVLGDTQPGAAG